MISRKRSKASFPIWPDLLSGSYLDNIYSLMIRAIQINFDVKEPKNFNQSIMLEYTICISMLYACDDGYQIPFETSHPLMVFVRPLSWSWFEISYRKQLKQFVALFQDSYVSHMNIPSFNQSDIAIRSGGNRIDRNKVI